MTDRVKSGEVSIKYCPTEEMRADLLTKPLQGAAFRKFRALILNLQDQFGSAEQVAPSHRSVLEETATGSTVTKERAKSDETEAKPGGIKSDSFGKDDGNGPDGELFPGLETTDCGRVRPKK